MGGSSKSSDNGMQEQQLALQKQQAQIAAEQAAIQRGERLKSEDETKVTRKRNAARLRALTSGSSGAAQLLGFATDEKLGA